jgi:hypothetical protein
MIHSKMIQIVIPEVEVMQNQDCKKKFFCLLIGTIIMVLRAWILTQKLKKQNPILSFHLSIIQGIKIIRYLNFSRRKIRSILIIYRSKKNLLVLVTFSSKINKTILKKCSLSVVVFSTKNRRKKVNFISNRYHKKK